MLVYGGSDASALEPYQHKQALKRSEEAPDILNSTANKFPHKIESELQTTNYYASKNMQW
jgi:hypothetical protein